MLHPSNYCFKQQQPPDETIIETNQPLVKIGQLEAASAASVNHLDVAKSWFIDAANHVGSHAHVLVLIGRERNDSDVARLHRIVEVSELRCVLIRVAFKYLEKKESIC